MTKTTKLTIIEVVLTVFILWISLSWGVFTIRHPKAGDGAFFVYFKEVVSFGTVDELK